LMNCANGSFDTPLTIPATKLVIAVKPCCRNELVTHGVNAKFICCCSELVK
jgi:hypothetical protein